MSIALTARRTRDAAPVRARPRVGELTTIRLGENSLKARVQENGCTVRMPTTTSKTSDEVTSTDQKISVIPKGLRTFIATPQGGSQIRASSPQGVVLQSPRASSPQRAMVQAPRAVQQQNALFTPSQPQVVPSGSFTNGHSPHKARPVGSQGDVFSAIKTLETFLSHAASSLPSAQTTMQQPVQRQISSVRALSPLRSGSVDRRASSPVHLLRQSSVTRQISVTSPLSPRSVTPLRSPTLMQSSRSITPRPPDRQARSPPPRVEVVPPVSSAIAQNVIDAPAATSPVASALERVLSCSEVQQQGKGLQPLSAEHGSRLQGSGAPTASREVSREVSLSRLHSSGALVTTRELSPRRAQRLTSGPVRMSSMQPISQVVASSSFPKMEPSKLALKSASTRDLQRSPRDLQYGPHNPAIQAAGLPQFVLPHAQQPIPSGFCGPYPSIAANARQNTGNLKSGGSTPPRYRIPSRGSFKEVVFSTPEGKHTGQQQNLLAGGSRPLGPLAESQQFVDMTGPESPDPRSTPKPPVPNPSGIPEW